MRIGRATNAAEAVTSFRLRLRLPELTEPGKGPTRSFFQSNEELNP